jgi:hypothetical protein
VIHQVIAPRIIKIPKKDSIFPSSDLKRGDVEKKRIRGTVIAPANIPEINRFRFQILSERYILPYHQRRIGNERNTAMKMILRNIMDYFFRIIS